MDGDLTLRGTTRPVTLEVTRTGEGVDPWGHQRVAFEASATLSRKEFGLTWNQALEAGGVLVGDEIAVTVELQAVAAGAQQDAA